VGSSEETCEGYARIAASLTKHTNTGNRLFFKQTFTQSLQAGGQTVTQELVGAEVSIRKSERKKSGRLAAKT